MGNKSSKHGKTKRKKNSLTENHDKPPPRPSDSSIRKGKQSKYHSTPPPTPHSTQDKSKKHTPRPPSGKKKPHPPSKPKDKKEKPGHFVAHAPSKPKRKQSKSTNAETSDSQLFKPRPPSEDENDRVERLKHRGAPPKPRAQSLKKNKSVVARPPVDLRTPRESKAADVAAELDFDFEELDTTQLFDPWSGISELRRKVFTGESDATMVCVYCRQIIPASEDIGKYVVDCPCGRVISTMYAQRTLQEPSKSHWARYVDEDDLVRFKRIHSIEDEKALAKEESKLMEKSEEELHDILENLGAGLQHYSSVQDKSGLVHLILMFHEWQFGNNLREGFVHRIRADGSIAWEPVGRYVFDPIDNCPQLDISSEEIVETCSKPFAYRLAWFKQHVNRIRIRNENGPLRIRLRREHMLEDSSNSILTMKAKQLWRSARYEFVGEPGMDSGGVAREWFSEVSNLIFMGGFGLFEYSSENDGRYQINPNSGVVNELHLQYFRFAGRLLGKSLFDNCFVNGRLTKVLYKHILSYPISAADLQHIDPQLWRSVKVIQECDDVSALALDFTYVHNEYGKSKVIELKPDGADIEVTNDNVQEYISVLLKHIMMDSISMQLSYFLRGFYEVIPQVLLSVFNHNELELLMCGQDKVDVKDWKANTTYRGEFKALGEKHQTVKWFWEIVEEFSQEKRGRLLRYTTGTSRVPVQGFKALQGGNGMLLFNIESIGKDLSVFPRSHTCFNRLELPLYESKDEMTHFMNEAILMDSGFNLE